MHPNLPFVLFFPLKVLVINSRGKKEEQTKKGFEQVDVVVCG